VKTLQKQLQQERYRLRLDGLFGRDTEDAVKRFQRTHGLDDNGVVGPHTWAALLADQSVPSLAADTADSASAIKVYSADDHVFLQETAEAEQYREIVASAAVVYDIPAPVIGGVGSRESRWGLALKLAVGGMIRATGTGDFAKRSYPTRYRTGPLPPDGGGFGRGLMQIDFDFHESARTGNWADPRENIVYGCRVLADYREFMRRRVGLQDAALIRAMLASYNAGPGNVLRALRDGRDVDFYTAGRNYSLDVLARADFFREHGWV
jgi:soluble lytic murein transglycosylase-like protein